MISVARLQGSRPASEEGSNQEFESDYVSENDDILCMEANNVEKESMQLQIIHDDNQLSSSNIVAFYPVESATNKSA